MIRTWTKGKSNYCATVPWGPLCAPLIFFPEITAQGQITGVSRSAAPSALPPCFPKYYHLGPSQSGLSGHHRGRRASATCGEQYATGLTLIKIFVTVNYNSSMERTLLFLPSLPHDRHWAQYGTYAAPPKSNPANDTMSKNPRMRFTPYNNGPQVSSPLGQDQVLTDHHA